MKAVLLALLLLPLSSCARPPLEAADSSRVQITSPDGKSFCGGTAVGTHTILTASHCLVDEDLTKIGINGKVANLTILSEDGNDHTLLSTSQTLQAARRGPLPPLGAGVVQVGMPRGVGPLLRLGYYMGSMESPVARLPGRLHLFDFPAAGGDSGSGIFDTKGRLVAVLSVTMSDPRASSWGPTGAFPLNFTEEQWKQIN